MTLIGYVFDNYLYKQDGFASTFSKDEARKFVAISLSTTSHVFFKTTMHGCLRIKIELLNSMSVGCFKTLDNVQLSRLFVTLVNMYGTFYTETI
jgi:hypothetical protein